MKNNLILLAVIFGMFFTQSCSGDKPSVEKQITRLWSYDTSNGSPEIDSTSYLKISIDTRGKDTIRNFESVLAGRRDVGTWKIEGNDELVLSSPLQNMETEVDSITQSFDENGNTKVHYYKENDEVATLENGKFSSKKIVQTYLINHISGSKLDLVYEGNSDVLLPFTYQSIIGFKP